MILHADAHLLIAVKPAGLLSVPGRGADKQDCLIARLQAAYPDALTVHRLDMATSGVMAFGRGIEAQRALSAAFAERRVAKSYVAVVAGHVAEAAGEVDLPLICDWPNRPLQKVDHERGKRALTRWRVLARGIVGGGGVTRVELEPVTGRSHQLRVHMAQMGHPILGDPFYAPPAVRAMSARLLLHARALTVPHPADAEMTAFAAEPGF